MRKFGRSLGKAAAVLAPLLILGSWATAADAQTGTVKLKVDHIFGYKPNGSPDPTKDKACAAKFSKLVQVVTTTYNINPKSTMMTARSTFSGTTYNLKSLNMGILYAFGYWQSPTGNPPLYAVLFNLSLKFTDPVSQIILSLDNNTYCLMTNASTPAPELKTTR